MVLELLIFIVKNAVTLLLSFVQIAMLVRAILSWFPINNRFVDFVYSVTEPFIYPVRRLFEKMGWFQGLPVDISFMVSYLLLTVILILLP